MNAILRRLTSIDNDTHPELDFTCTYDPVGNIASETRGGTMSGSFCTATYDDEQRLTTWDVSTGDDESWNLSLVGNWDSYTSGSNTETRTHGDAHELTGITGGNNAGSLTYDSRGNMTSDTNGMSFSWDHDGMLTSVTVPATSPVGIEGTHTYEYDVLGRRLAKTVNDVPNATTTKTTFVQRLVSLPPLGTQGGQVLCEYESENTGPTTLARQYTYGSYVDEPLWQHELTANEQYTLHQDRRYNVVGVTDHTNTALLAKGNYTGYGQGVLQATTAGQGVDFEKVIQGFAGRTIDRESNAINFRFRMYSPKLGRFLRKDPTGFSSNSLCLYDYVDNNPFSAVDPSGLHSFKFCFDQFAECLEMAYSDYYSCNRCAKSWRDRIICRAIYEGDKRFCDAEFFACVATSDEVKAAVAAGAITIFAILAIAEPTPAGEAALAAILAGVAVDD